MWILELMLLLVLLIALGTGIYMYAALKEFRAHDIESYARSLRGESARYKQTILDAIERNRAIDARSVALTARDGTRLYADWYPASGTARGTVILVHGYRGSSRSDFSCAIPLYHALGWNELLVDQRAQGRSGGKRMGLGVLERFDVADWAAWCAARRPGEPIVLSGISMGASSVMMACGLPLPEEVCGVIADCGFTSPEDIIRWLFKKNGRVGLVLMPLCRLLAKPVLGFGLRDCDTTKILGRCTLPLLLVHGQADTLVPCEMSQRNYDASIAEDKTFVSVPGAVHGLSFLVDRETCTRTLRGFLTRVSAGYAQRGIRI